MSAIRVPVWTSPVSVVRGRQQSDQARSKVELSGRAKHWSSSVKIVRKHADTWGCLGACPPRKFFKILHSEITSQPLWAQICMEHNYSYSVNVLLWKTSQKYDDKGQINYEGEKSG